MKSKAQIFNQKCNGIIITEFNFSLYKENDNIKENDYKNRINNNYLQFKNTQSLSTCIDDIKNNEIKYSLSMKDLIPFKLLKNFSYINEINSYLKLSFDLFQKHVNLKYVNEKDKKFDNKNITSENIRTLKNDVNINKNIKNKNNIVLNYNKKGVKNINIINDKKNNKNIKIFQDNNINNDNLLFKKELLKSFPPKIPNLYDKKYLLEQNANKNYFYNNTYKKINQSEVPNTFYNHIMYINNKKFNSISITNRIKGKLLTILYYSPI